VPFKIAFRRVAQKEHRAAVRWYESQREGLGERYLNAIAMKLAEIQQFPTRFGKVRGETRRAFVPVFPFAIYYRVIGNSKLRIIAVMHTSRDPAIWQGRSDEEE
jgi:plasmid stabilization system protein ParE